MLAETLETRAIASKERPFQGVWEGLDMKFGQTPLKAAPPPGSPLGLQLLESKACPSPTAL